MRNHYQVLSIFFSLGLHGILASFLLLPSQKSVEKESFAIEMMWEKAPVMESALPKGGAAVGAELKSEVNVASVHPPTSVPFRALRSVRTEDGSARHTVRPERRLPELVEGSRSRRIDRSSAGVAMVCKENFGKKSLPMGGTTTTAPSIKTHQPLPKYPWICRKRGQEGCVSLVVQTNGEGRVIRVRLDKSSGYASLDQSALNAVKTWVFADNVSQKTLSFAFRLKG